MTEPRCIVIGVGNPYRRDDGVGPFVVEQLRPRIEATCIVHTKDGADLMERWSPEDFVYVVDATSSGCPPGTLVRIDARDRSVPTSFFRYSSHAFGLAEAIELARTLGRLPKRLVVFGIEGEEWSAGEGLSPEVDAAGREVANRIEQEFNALANRDRREDPRPYTNSA